MILADALKESKDGLPPNGTAGIETDWLSFCELDVSSGLLWAGDPNIVNRDDGYVAKVPAGRYLLEAKVMDFAGHKRISRLRASLTGMTNVRMGRQIGETGTDSARIALCDIGEFEKAIAGHEELFERRLEDYYGGGLGIIKAQLARLVELPFVSSGFGDGTGPVLELRSSRKRVGIELEFIVPGEIFDYTPPAPPEDRPPDRMQTLINARACLHCKGSGQCYCLRNGAPTPAGCPRCNGLGTCRICKGSGKLQW